MRPEVVVHKELCFCHEDEEETACSGSVIRYLVRWTSQRYMEFSAFHYTVGFGEFFNMERWRIGDAWPPAGEKVLWIGVVAWSMYDVELLDVLEAKLSHEPQY